MDEAAKRLLEIHDEIIAQIEKVHGGNTVAAIMNQGSYNRIACQRIAALESIAAGLAEALEEQLANTTFMGLQTLNKSRAALRAYRGSE